MRIKAMCIALCALAPAVASADGNRFDLYYTPLATYGDDEVAAKGDGFGARLQAQFDTALVHFEYSAADYSILDDGINQLRVGAGMRAGDIATIHAEYLQVDVFGTDADGFGAHVQFSQPADEGAGAFLRLGYLTLETDDSAAIGIDGFEYAVGATFPLGTVRGLLEFRSSQLEDEDGFKLYLEDLHLGVSMPFGG